MPADRARRLRPARRDAPTELGDTRFAREAADGSELPCSFTRPWTERRPFPGHRAQRLALVWGPSPLSGGCWPLAPCAPCKSPPGGGGAGLSWGGGSRVPGPQRAGRARGGLPPSHLPLGPGARPPVPHWRPASPSTRPRPPPAVPGPVWLAPCGANQGWEIKKAQSPPPAPPCPPPPAAGRVVRVGPVPLPACCRRRRSPPGAGRAGPAPGPGRAPQSGCGRPPAGGRSSARARRRP